MANKHNYKITDEQFIETLRENNGVLALVAKAIQTKYGVSYARQTVYERAAQHSEELQHIRETIVDYSEGRLIKCVTDDDTDKKLSSKIAMFFLNSLGKDRGYGKNGVDKVLNQIPEQVYNLGGEIIRF